MSLTPTNLANLQALSLTGRVPVAEYIKVTWTTGVVNYYGAAAWNDEAPFTGIGHTIEPRLIKDPLDPFSRFERNPDIRSSEVEIVFDDIDKSITALFQAHSYGVTAEIFLYYPSESATE